MLTWQNERWHCEGKGIHAGDFLEIKMPNRDVTINGAKMRWLPVRIESYNHGNGLAAHYDIGGLCFVHTVDTEFDELRWPA